MTEIERKSDKHRERDRGSNRQIEIDRYRRANILKKTENRERHTQVDI